MTQEQRNRAFDVAESLPRLENTVRISANGCYISPSNAPALESTYADSLVFEWDAFSCDDEGRRGIYRLRENAK